MAWTDADGDETATPDPGSDSDDSSSASPDADPSGGIKWSLISDALPGLRTFLLAFPAIGAGVADLLLGESGKPDPGLLTEPKKFIIDIIETWIIDALLIPVLDFVVTLFATLADSALYVAFGSDRTVGVYSTIGLVDIPMYLVSELVTALDPAVSSVYFLLYDINQAIADIAAQAGIAAPIVIPLLWMAWVAVLGYVAWTIVSAIDIPGVRLVPLINRLVAPVRAAFNWLFK